MFTVPRKAVWAFYSVAGIHFGLALWFLVPPALRGSLNGAVPSVVSGLLFMIAGLLWFRLGIAERNRIHRLHRLLRNLCLKCGYPLKGLPSPRCPECNTTFDPDRLPESSR